MVLVAGAGRGIECATAVALGKANTHIVLATCTKADLQTIATLVHAAGGEATVMPVMAEPHVKRLVETAAAVTGTIDVVVCSAGVAVRPILTASKCSSTRRYFET